MITIIFILSSLLLLPFLSHRRTWPLASSSLLLLTFLSLLALYQPFLSPSICSFSTLNDQISSSLVTLSLWVSALILIASNYVYSSNNNHLFFSLSVLLLCLILCLSFSVSNFLNFFILFETSLIPTLLLILGWGYQPERLQAGLYLMLYTICASLPLLLSLILIINFSGHLSINLTLIAGLPPVNHLLGPIWWFITIISFIVNIPLYTVHLWLPNAHVEAPVAGSIILAGLLLNLGGYGLLRMSALFPTLSFNLSPIWNSVALWGALITSMICLRQSDIKSLIAYSSVGHIALVIIGTSISTQWGWQGALAIIISHGLCSSCLFSLANITYESTHTRSIFLTNGLIAVAPTLSIWWFILSIINIAAPPSINLFSEISLIISAIWASPFYIILVGLCSFLAAAYSLFLFTSINHGATPPFSNPINTLSSHSHTVCFFHAAPIFLLISIPSIISSWFWS